MISRAVLLSLVLVMIALSAAIAADPSPAPAQGGNVVALPLPGAPPDGVMLDYLAIDHTKHQVWVPAGGTGSTDVIDTATREIHRVEKFPVREVEREGKKRVLGPSSVTIGVGVAFVGNRADSSVCAVDTTTLVRGGCVTLSTMPDGVAFVGRTREVWVTTPRDNSIVVLDVSVPKKPTIAAIIKLAGAPEGYAVDDGRGFFYTNLEDKDRTVQIDVLSRQVTATWSPECGEAGPRGLAYDPLARLLMVACTDHVEVLNAAKHGEILSKLDTGAGLDNIDFLPARRWVYAAAAGAGTLTVARVDEKGILQRTATVATEKGARNAVVAEDGVAYVADGPGGKILVVKPVEGEQAR